MNTQQAQQLAAEAATLLKNLSAEYSAAPLSDNFAQRKRIVRIQEKAFERWERRYDAWCLAAYGPQEVR